MITVITGTPGAGKTAAAISLLLQMVDRPIFVDGISELQIEHYPCPPFDEWTSYVNDSSAEDGKKLIFNFPENAVVVIDEAQRKFRPAGSGAKIPPVIAAFETHRHDGIDFILITQGPHLLHSNVRLLTGRHIHIRDVGVLGRWWYEFPECSCPPSFKSAPVKRRYRLPRSTFSLYKSASFHTKHRQPIPTALKVLFVALGCLIFIGYRNYGSLSNRLSFGTTQNVSAVPKDGVISVSQVIEQEKVDGNASHPPSDSSRKFQEPAEGGVLSPPINESFSDDIGGCISGDKSCKCYSRTGRRLETPYEQCMRWINSAPWSAQALPKIWSVRYLISGRIS